MPRLLLVEDDPNISDFIIRYARSENYEITRVADGPTGLAEALSGSYDLVILDVMLPGMSGTDVCRQIRVRLRVPVIFLSARDDEIDKVLGLEMGADDYLTKPFSPRELLARIKAVLRRFQAAPDADSSDSRGSAAASVKPDGAPAVTAGPVAVDRQRRKATVDGNALELTCTQFEILLKLASNPGRVFSREEIYLSVWGESGEGMSRTVDVHIKHLREAICRAKSGYNPIISVRGVGYKFGDD